MNRFQFFPFILAFTLSKSVFGQYSSIDVGVMRMNYKRNSVFKDANWTGFTINAGGFTFTRYAGSVPLSNPDTLLPKGWQPKGHYWNMGITQTFTDGLLKIYGEERMPLLVPSLGMGIGGWKTHEAGAWMTLGLNGNLALNILPGLAVYGGFESGFGFKGILGDPIEPLYPNVPDAFPRFFLHPRAGVRIFYNFSKSLGDVSTTKERYVNPGWHTYTHTDEYGWSRTFDYYDEGGNRSSYGIITTPEIGGIYPKMYFNNSKDGQGKTTAYGGGFALRYGAFALDIEHMNGKVGYKADIGSVAGSQLLQNTWNYSNTSFGFGINVFNIVKPFSMPSLYRFILGRRWGNGKMISDLSAQSAVVWNVVQPQDYQSIKFNHFYMAAELGRFGLSWEKIKDPNHEYYNGSAFSAYYIIPLIYE